VLPDSPGDITYLVGADSLVTTINAPTFNPGGASSEFSCTFDLTLQDGSDMPNFMTKYTDSSWITDLTISTSQTSNAGAYALRYSVTATHNTNSGITRTKTIDFAVTVSDACGATTLVS